MTDIGKEMLKYQADLAEEWGYKPIPPFFAMDIVQKYYATLPWWCILNGDCIPLYSENGTQISNGYTRIVIGHYGAFIEISPSQIIKDNLKIKEGQEYRINDEQYSKHVKYHWLTTKDGSDCKIYLQQKTVDYADYVPGMYYISPFEIKIR